MGKSFSHIVRTAGESLAGRASEECFLQLASASWFTGRVTACLVVSALCSALGGAARTKVVEAYQKLCEDSTPMVRRAGARVISDVAKAFDGEMSNSEEAVFVSLLKRLGLEDQESIRLKALENMDALFTSLPSKGRQLAREMTTRCAKLPSFFPSFFLSFFLSSLSKN